MSTPRYARWAAHLLARHDAALPSSDSARARGIATIERALAARRPHRRWAAVAGCAAVAAGVVAWLALTQFETPGVARSQRVAVLVFPTREGARLRDSRGELPVEGSTELPSGGRLSTQLDGGATLKLSTGTRLELGSGSELTLVRQDALQLFALQQGRVDAQIAKLAVGQRFVIDTPDAQIEVRGTVFRLEVLQASQRCGAGVRSRLEVSEGVVEVRSRARVLRVAAGEHWPSDCETAARYATAAALPAAAQPVASEPAEEPAEVSTPALPTAPARNSNRSSLAAQNDAFRAALRARERGDDAGALRAYAQFIRRYPASPLAENAYVERLRLLASGDPTRARAEAARYLERYPNGFAREEAERIRGTR